LVAAGASAQEAPTEDTRTQYPSFLTNSYFDLNVGSMRYLFTADQLAPGFQAESIAIPKLGARVDLFGHQITKHLAAQVTYMRPAQYVVYNNVNGDKQSHQISAAYGGVTLVWSVAVTDRVSAYGEGGWGVTSRSGFDIDGKNVLQDTHFAAGLLGAGFAYHATPKFDWLLSATYSPSRKSFAQPSMRLFTVGLRYKMPPLPAATVEENRRTAFTFPLNVVRLGYTDNNVGYGVNDLFSQKIPIFWGGNVQVRRGFTLDYQRNVFHTKDLFAFDLGASTSYWASDLKREAFGTFSVYPLFRFFLARTASTDVYVGYSLAGPTYISQRIVDGLNTGERFTFQDFMGIGGFFGKARRLNAELGIKHYSNGNIFTRNASFKVPLTLSLGLTF
jgi:hypothetical protein